jgi:hypothetical protein
MPFIFFKYYFTLVDYAKFTPYFLFAPAEGKDDPSELKGSKKRKAEVHNHLSFPLLYKIMSNIKNIAGIP